MSSEQAKRKKMEYERLVLDSGRVHGPSPGKVTLTSRLPPPSGSAPTLRTPRSTRSSDVGYGSLPHEPRRPDEVGYIESLHFGGPSVQLKSVDESMPLEDAHLQVAPGMADQKVCVGGGSPAIRPIGNDESCGGSGGMTIFVDDGSEDEKALTPDEKIDRRLEQGVATDRIVDELVESQCGAEPTLEEWLQQIGSDERERILNQESAWQEKRDGAPGENETGHEPDENETGHEPDENETGYESDENETDGDKEISDLIEKKQLMDEEMDNNEAISPLKRQYEAHLRAISLRRDICRQEIEKQLLQKIDTTAQDR